MNIFTVGPNKISIYTIDNQLFSKKYSFYIID